LLALLLHALVITIIVVLTYFKLSHTPEPMHRVEVMMISSKELAEMVRPHPKQEKPALKPKAAAKSKPKPALKPEIKPELKPQPKPTPKPETKPAAKETAKAKPAKTKTVDKNFDPFAPVVSSSNTKAAARTHTPDLADIAGKQLTTSETEKYIAMIQGAVQEKWKVPASVNYTSDPVVELHLRPNGEVESVRILTSSGNATLDASLERAIRAAAPFQVPPGMGFELFRVNTITFRPMK